MGIYVNKQLDQVPARYRPLVEDCVGRLCTYLNGFAEGQEGWHYEVGTFLDTNVNPYAVHCISFAREVKDDGLYMELCVGDGDEGGGSTLYIRAERDWHYENTGRKVHRSYQDYEVLEYRTDGPNLVAQEPTTHHYVADEERVVYDDTYRLSFLVHEFDTTFSTIYTRET